MLSRVNRLPKEEMPRVFRGGFHVRGDAIELVYRKTKEPSRFAFIVSSKTEKRAAARNRMRRLMSESVRHVVNMSQPLDGIFIAKKNFADMRQPEVEKIVRGLLRL